MVALKSNEVDAFVARPSPERPIVLVCGPDAGLVHERAEKIINASVDDPNDPFALVRIEGDALAAEPSRLVEEAHTVPLFGGRRAVWVKAGSRNFAAAVEAVVASPPTDCRIVIEAGDLRRTAPVRAICEKAKCAAVLPCYVDTERDLIRLVDDEMREARLTIAPDARAALVSLIGGDRQASRSEIRKLALYAHGKDRVTWTTCSRWSPTLRRWRSMAWSTRPSPAGRPRPRRSSPRRWPPAHRPGRSCRGRCAT